QPANVLTLEANRARGRRQASADQIEQRRLAGSIRADHGVALAERNREAHAPDDLGRTEILAQIVELDAGIHASLRRVRWISTWARCHASDMSGEARRTR